jgi:pimeloyl-ACP methyl ester carboxylesterase
MPLAQRFATAARSPRGSTKDDSAGMRSLLDDAVGPMLLVGHSFGGMVLTEAGAHPSVRHLVYLDALMLDVATRCSRRRTVTSPKGSLRACTRTTTGSSSIRTN